MTWNDLSPPERIALAGLARAMVRIDRSYSNEESQRLHGIAQELGEPEAFWEALEQAEQTITGPEHLRDIATAVRRDAARQLILEVLEGLATAETMSRAEEAMIAELRALWGMAPA